MSDTLIEKCLVSRNLGLLISSRMTMTWAFTLRQRSVQRSVRFAAVITSVAKDRKVPSGGKSRTREADDAAIFA